MWHSYVTTLCITHVMWSCDISGDTYYRYTEGEGIDVGYPRRLSVWTGLPNSVDAALQTTDGEHIFFKGDLHYFYDDYYFDVSLKVSKMIRPYKA